ncbi:tripartite tricarboxylate transporter substrate binding protein [Verticiella sediminum]|uniref:Tripartite tricarboxylate transporter substrate binding protein n=1 Tax=Verticiella sediminum TaxID=1247510 RepID=A0A556B0J0_9BURK|nr:tripartite tricarboxylate transporter substrate binding protein [Verticiella sediminum]TSH98654.1 tripartite tricarboxylate transporter substrate binding protein [Verticiella sediminum]
MSVRSPYRRRFERWAAALLFVLALPAAAADWPQRPITLVIPYPPGGSTDMIARQYGELLGRQLGQSVIVENRPGASTNIGADWVARAPADGYTLLFGGNGLALNRTFGPQPSFDPDKAFAPVALLARVPFVVAAHPATPYGTPAELMAAAHKTPGKLTISSAQLNLYVELLKKRADIDLLHVPYKGGAQAVTDAIAGQVNMVFALTPVVLPHIQAGTLKPIAVSSAERVAVLPNVPTFKESGAPEYVVTVWYGILAPAGTPPAIVERLAQATQTIVHDKDFSDQLTKTGVVLEASTPQGLADILAEETAFWRQLAVAVPTLVTDSPR